MGLKKLAKDIYKGVMNPDESDESTIGGVKDDIREAESKRQQTIHEQIYGKKQTKSDEGHSW